LADYFRYYGEVKEVPVDIIDLSKNYKFIKIVYPYRIIDAMCLIGD